MKEINISKQKLFDVVDSMMKRRDFEYARIYAIYHPRHGLKLRYFGANYKKNEIHFHEDVHYIDVTSCFDSVSKMLIVQNIMEKIEIWLSPKSN